MNIIKHKAAFLTFSTILVGISIAAIAVWGFQEGIDFKGGALLTFRTAEQSTKKIEEVFTRELDVHDARVTFNSQNRSYFARLSETNEEQHQVLTTTLSKQLPNYEELSFQSIGPSIGKELRKKSITALILVLIGISFYIAYAFRKVYRPVSSWKYGFITLITLFHDVIVPAGLFAILGHYGGAEIDTNFIVALLVVIGFSVHDTIVVFDRIRENLLLDKGKTDFGTVINDSVNQTIARSINTSLTLILVLLAMYFAGPLTLKYFVLTMLVGVTTGIYSSIFVASPLLHLWQRTTARRS